MNSFYHTENTETAPSSTYVKENNVQTNAQPSSPVVSTAQAGVAINVQVGRELQRRLEEGLMSPQQLRSELSAYLGVDVKEQEAVSIHSLVAFAKWDLKKCLQTPAWDLQSFDGPTLHIVNTRVQKFMTAICLDSSWKLWNGAACVDFRLAINNM
jgi:hypothetical protein